MKVVLLTALLTLIGGALCLESYRWFDRVNQMLSKENQELEVELQFQRIDNQIKYRVKEECLVPMIPIIVDEN